MVIEKVHGIQATAMSLNDRFALLSKIVPKRQPQQWKRTLMDSLNYKDRLIVEQLAQRLKAQRAFKQRLGTQQPGLRRFVSESNLPQLRRSNSYGNLSQQSVKDRVSWRQSNGNLNRSASFSNLSSVSLRGFRRRGGGQRLRGKFRGRGVGSMRGNVGNNTRGVGRGPKVQTARRARPALRQRGGISRKPNPQQKVVTKEELDLQLDQYMAGTKAALDLELDMYMQNAMEME